MHKQLCVDEYKKLYQDNKNDIDNAIKDTGEILKRQFGIDECEKIYEDNKEKIDREVNDACNIIQDVGQTISASIGLNTNDENCNIY